MTFELDGVDRLYLNAYVPQLQMAGGFVRYVLDVLKMPVAATPAVASKTRQLVSSIEGFAKSEGVPLITFKKNQRKDDVAREFLRDFEGDEGVLFIGKAQEKTRVFRTTRWTSPTTGRKYPHVTWGSAMVNHFYFYAYDKDFGPFFIKMASYFPYTCKVCINGHEWLKCQLANRGIEFEALDNGLLSCEDPKRAQRIANSLTPRKIEAFFRKWMARLPQAFSSRDKALGYRYRLSILQAEFSRTQVFDKPRYGRTFFEEVIRENIDLGRPDVVQLIFSRKTTRATPGSFRTRVITKGVIPSLHVQYKSSRIKQYFKEGRALRTETTINNTRDFGLPKGLDNLPALQEVGYTANRRLLDVQSTSHDCTIGLDRFEGVVQSRVVGKHRASALNFGQPRVMALMSVLCMLRFIPRGFSNRDTRELVAQLLGLEPAQIRPGRMTYDLRRLRLHGIIARIPKTHRYIVTDEGLRIVLFFTRVYERVFRVGLSLERLERSIPSSSGKKIPRSFQAVLSSIDKLLEESHLPAA